MPSVTQSPSIYFVESRLGLMKEHEVRSDLDGEAMIPAYVTQGPSGKARIVYAMPHGPAKCQVILDLNTRRIWPWSRIRRLTIHHYNVSTTLRPKDADQCLRGSSAAAERLIRRAVPA